MRFAAVMPKASGQSTVNTIDERLYIRLYPYHMTEGSAKLPTVMPKTLPKSVALPE